MITALTDLLSSVMTTGQIKTVSSQEQAQSFANAMDDLLATDQHNPATGTDDAPAAKADVLSGDVLPSDLLPGDLKQPAGSAELQFAMDESTMDMIKSGQGGLSGSADPVSTRSGDAPVGQPVSEVQSVERSSGGRFNQTMSDLTTMATAVAQPSSLADSPSAELMSAAPGVQTAVHTQEDALGSGHKTTQTVGEAVSGRAGSDVLSTLDLSKTYVESARASVQVVPNTTAHAHGLNVTSQVAGQLPASGVLSESLPSEAQALKSAGLSPETRLFTGEGLRASSLEQAAQSDHRLEALADKPALSALAGAAKTDVSVSSMRSLDAVGRTSVNEPQQFGNDMATHVRVLKRQGGGEVKINLHPAELGRMSITVVTEGADTRVAFVVETPQARQAVENALPRLRDMMDDAGLSLADSDVSEHRHSEDAHDQRDSKGGAAVTTATDVDTPVEAMSLSVSMDPSRLVDTYI